jgi:hypothetical protein
MPHTCHWPGCPIEVPPKLWGCRKHWYTLPQHLRDRIWKAYRPGQEINKTPSREYVDAARDVQEWIRQHEAAGDVDQAQGSLL